MMLLLDRLSWKLGWQMMKGLEKGYWERKGMNPHDVAKTDAERCKYGLDFLGIGKERSNDLCTMLCHLIWDCA